MKFIPLSEGAFTVDQSKKFIPFEINKDDLQARTKGSILVEIQPFAVITSNDIIILDTGLGFTNGNGQPQIHNNLASHGISSTDVTKVLLSHLHKDHSGGILFPDKKQLSFKNADYYINKQEWNFALEKGFPSYHTDDFLFLKENKRLHFTEDKGKIDGYITCEISGEKIFFGGDVAPQFQQMKNRFKAKYDYDGSKAMELRKEWWEIGEKEKWTFLFYHDIKIPAYRF